jgi:hypothetical protein
LFWLASSPIAGANCGEVLTRARRKGMQFGFNLPNSGKLAGPEIMARIAHEGEALGYDYLTVTDHVVLPDKTGCGMFGTFRST